MPTLKKSNKPISYDFSNTYTIDYIKDVISYVDYAFFSASNYTDRQISEFQKYIKSMGPQLVLVTKGSRGASLYYGDKYYQQAAFPVEVIDSLGAGDGFIARLLVGIYSNEVIEQTLISAAREAASICNHNGALGYGIDM